MDAATASAVPPPRTQDSDEIIRSESAGRQRRAILPRPARPSRGTDNCPEGAELPERLAARSGQGKACP